MNFVQSQPSKLLNNPEQSTGNFPAHPELIKVFANKAGFVKTDKIIDIGHGSGIVLNVLYEMGFNNLTGVELARIPFNISKSNLSRFNISLLNGNAFDVDLSPFNALCFFSPFRAELANEFIKRLPQNVTKMIVINADIETIQLIKSQGYESIYEYQHPLYKNFNGHSFVRTVS
jgi:16S rRNA A1518/A1519 N6-dimethyltransferase RsmA/KsgA/DIM1 with predicted DNA glycosylase/AP lyase activity